MQMELPAGLLCCQHRLASTPWEAANWHKALLQPPAMMAQLHVGVCVDWTVAFVHTSALCMLPLTKFHHLSLYSDSCCIIDHWCLWHVHFNCLQQSTCIRLCHQVPLPLTFPPWSRSVPSARTRQAVSCPIIHLLWFSTSLHVAMVSSNCLRSKALDGMTTTNRE